MTRRATCSRACEDGPSGRSCCARTWTPCRRTRPWSRCSTTGRGRTRTPASSAPTTRRRWRCWSRLARRCSVEGSPVGVEPRLHRPGGDRAAWARRRSTSPSSRRTSATCSTTRRRSARSSPPRRRSTGSRPSSSASPPTRASGLEAGTRPSSPPRTASAMPHGRIDAETTANLGYFHGGVESTNVVPERARLLAEVRSVNPDKAGRGAGGDDRRAARRREPRRSATWT